MTGGRKVVAFSAKDDAEAHATCTEAEVADYLDLYREAMSPCVASIYALDTFGREHLIESRVYFPQAALGASMRQANRVNGTIQAARSDFWEAGYYTAGSCRRVRTETKRSARRANRRLGKLLIRED